MYLPSIRQVKLVTLQRPVTVPHESGDDVFETFSAYVALYGMLANGRKKSLAPKVAVHRPYPGRNENAENSALDRPRRRDLWIFWSKKRRPLSPILVQDAELSGVVSDVSVALSGTRN